MSSSFFSREKCKGYYERIKLYLLNYRQQLVYYMYGSWTVRKEIFSYECGHLMEFEDEWEDTLVCPHCGHSIDLDDYGREGNEEYENLYPTREEVLGIANDDSEEDSDD